MYRNFVSPALIGALAIAVAAMGSSVQSIAWAKDPPKNAGASKPAGLDEEELLAVTKIFKSVYDQPSRQGVAKSLPALKDLPYAETGEYMLALLQLEKKVPFNVAGLDAMADVLEKVGTRDQVARFRAVRDILMRKYDRILGAAANRARKAKWAAIAKTMEKRAPFPRFTKRPPRTPINLQFTTTAFHKMDAFQTLWYQELQKLFSSGWLPKITLQSVSAEMREQLMHGRSPSPIIGREYELDRISAILAREDTRIPLIHGGSGVGKGAIIEALAGRYLTGPSAATPPNRSRLHNPQVIITTPQAFRKAEGLGTDSEVQGAVTDYLEQAKTLAYNTDGTVIIVIESAEDLNDLQIEAVRLFEEKNKSKYITSQVRLILSSSSQNMGKLVGNERLMKLVEPVIVDELNKPATLRVLKEIWAPAYLKTYQVAFDDETLRAIVDLAPEYRPDLERVRGPALLMQDLALKASKGPKAADGVAHAELSDLYRFVAEANKLPVVPQDREKFFDFMEKTRAALKTEVLGQERMVDVLVDQFSSSLTSETKKHSVVMVMGTTGVGKTYVAERLAHQYYGNDQRVLTVDMTKYVSDEAAVWELFGVTTGFIGSDSGKNGIVCDFLDGPGRGNNVIILNEFEKAHPDVQKKFMELFDRGVITGGDGQLRRLGRSLILLTSNKGATKAFPDSIMENLTVEERARRMAGLTQAKLKAAFMERESFSSEKGAPPELLERIDEWIFAAPLVREEAVQIAKLETAKVANEIGRSWKGTIEIDDRFYSSIVDASFNPAKGIREVKRQVAKSIKASVNSFFQRYRKQSNIRINVLQAANNPTSLSFETVSIGDASEKVVMQGPRIPTKNLLLDPELRGRIRTMEADVSRRIFGQEVAVEKVVSGIKAQVANPGTKSPASIALFGTTGTGKTELAKEVAGKRYGRADAYGRIDMGEIKTTADMNNIFSSARGYLGSDSIGKFERILQDNPDGCVVIFDEISNAGGGDPKVKNEILKMFYPILDEGKWTSSVTGKEYTMKNFTFIFTGNDLENRFQSVRGDDLLDSIYRDLVANPADLESELVSKGFPEAFLGRMKSVVVMKPPSFESKVKIARKLLEDWMREFMAHQPFELRFRPGFEEELADLLFTAQKGGRSIRNFLDTTLGSLAADSILDFDWEALDREKGVVEVWIESEKPKVPFFARRPDAKSAVLRVRSTHFGKTVYEGTADFTRDSQFVKQIRKIDAWGTAFHEAGHAVVNDPRYSGKKLAMVTIVPNGKYLGYARYERVPGMRTNSTRDDLIRDIAGLLAGGEAEEMMGRPRNTGMADDFAQIHKKIQHTVIKGGLLPQLGGVPVDEHGAAQLSEAQAVLYEKYSKDVMAEATTLARKELAKNWAWVTLVAKDLIKTGSITGARVDELRAAATDPVMIDRYSHSRVSRFLERMEAHCRLLFLKN